MTDVITRGLIEYDCLGLGSCAAYDGGSCPCARRWKGERVPFPAVAERAGPPSAANRNPPPPTLGDLMREAFDRRKSA